MNLLKIVFQMCIHTFEHTFKIYITTEPANLYFE